MRAVPAVRLAHENGDEELQHERNVEHSDHSARNGLDPIAHVAFSESSTAGKQQRENEQAGGDEDLHGRRCLKVEHPSNETDAGPSSASFRRTHKESEPKAA